MKIYPKRFRHLKYQSLYYIKFKIPMLDNYFLMFQSSRVLIFILKIIYEGTFISAYTFSNSNETYIPSEYSETLLNYNLLIMLQIIVFRNFTLLYYMIRSYKIYLTKSWGNILYTLVIEDYQILTSSTFRINDYAFVHLIDNIMSNQKTKSTVK